MSGTIEAFLGEAFIASCRDELAAPKPGNVHVFADGHGMTVDHFIESAKAAAPFLCRAGASVGARIEGAVAATNARIGLNTNLGIVLLCAPLAAAAEAAARADGGDQRCDETSFRAALNGVLQGLTQEDATAAFAAIVRASPAGLGESTRHDVRAPATANLFEAMKEAAGRDRIAYQYVSGFSDILTTGRAALVAARKKNWPAPWPTVAVYMTFLAGIFDTHILRKNGLAAAETIQQAAIAQRNHLIACDDPAQALDRLLDFDRRLKDCRINPGTSADLTVATLFADRIILS